MQLTPGGGIPSDVIHIDIPTIPENSKEKGPVIVPLPVEIRPKMCRYRIEVWSNTNQYFALKRLVSDKKNLQTTLQIRENTFQSQHVSVFSKKLHNFDRNMTFHDISFCGH